MYASRDSRGANQLNRKQRWPLVLFFCGLLVACGPIGQWAVHIYSIHCKL